MADRSTIGGLLAARLDWLWADTRAKIASTWLLVMVVMALFAPLLAPLDPAEQDPTRFLEGPSGDFWLGTDDVGRDILSRLIFGARASMYASFLAVFSGLYFTVSLLTDATFREEFLDDVVDDVRQALAVRAVYLSRRGSAGLVAASSTLPPT